MSLRIRLVLALGLIAALGAVSIGLWSYVAVGNQLRSEVDRSLDDSLHIAIESGRGGHLPDNGRRPPQGGDDPTVDDARPLSVEQVAVQVIDATGTIVYYPTTLTLPVSGSDLSLAASKSLATTNRREVTINGQSYRMATAPLGNGQGAAMAARPFGETQRVLDATRNRTILSVSVVTLLAAAAGWLAARQLTRRLVRLTAAAEHVADTGRLDVSVPAHGKDEAGRLAHAFNSMLGALARSKEDQQRLVQDAGHELRTPLTSLRTNIAVLHRYDRLTPEMRTRVLEDLEGEARELTTLVNEIVEVATDQRSDEPEQSISLAAVAQSVAARAARRSGRQVVVEADSSIVTGRPAAVERAISNLVDNAIKFDPQGVAPIEVVVAQGRIEVRDRGPGVDPADLPHLFDRFYRSVAARSRPGSGLGLSIVRTVAENHGGTAFASNRDGGGAVVGLTLPVR